MISRRSTLSPSTSMQLSPNVESLLGDHDRSVAFSARYPPCSLSAVAIALPRTEDFSIALTNQCRHFPEPNLLDLAPPLRRLNLHRTSRAPPPRRRRPPTPPPLPLLLAPPRFPSNPRRQQRRCLEFAMLTCLLFRCDKRYCSSLDPCE